MCWYAVSKAISAFVLYRWCQFIKSILDLKFIFVDFLGALSLGSELGERFMTQLWYISMHDNLNRNRLGLSFLDFIFSIPRCIARSC
jgi:hypothetical protein